MRKLSHQTDFQADEDSLLLGKLLLDSDYKEKTLTRTFNSLNAHGLILFVCLFLQKQKGGHPWKKKPKP